MKKLIIFGLCIILLSTIFVLAKTKDELDEDKFKEYMKEKYVKFSDDKDKDKIKIGLDLKIDKNLESTDKHTKIIHTKDGIKSTIIVHNDKFDKELKK